MTKAQKAERDEQITKLREMLKPGDTVYTVLDHVSSSGMSRAIRVVVPYVRHQALIDGHWEDRTLEQLASIHGPKEPPIVREVVDHLHLNYAVGIVLGLRHWKRNGREQDALVVGGCGMDMGFHLVYELSHVLYGSGYACLGKGQCPSPYHTNHRDQIRCDGADGRICWRPGFGSRFPVPDDWPTSAPIDIGDGQTIPGHLLACLHTEHEGAPYEVCPTCKGAGSLPNPEGPERFDLMHTDGYALHQRWL